MKLLLLFAFSLPLLAVTPPAFLETDAEKVDKTIEALQTEWDKGHSYQAHFKQTITTKGLSEPEVAEGILSVVKPNKIRWENKTDGTIQLTDGKEFVLIQPNPRRKTVVVDVYRSATRALGTKRFQFLAGKAKFKDNYDLKLVEETPRTIKIRFSPKDEKDEGYLAEFLKGSYVLVSLVSETQGSRVVLEFTNTKKNVELPDKFFKYEKNPDHLIHYQ